MSSEFQDAVRFHQSAFGFDLKDEQIGRLADHYTFVQENNPILHLVGPSTPEEFATRHILESLTLLKHLPQGAKFADVGAGAGLPSIPCLIVREDLKAVQIESKEKKASFLNEAIERLDLAGRCVVVNKQFTEVDLADCGYVTCRAIDKFTENLPRMIKWAGRRTLLLFGGPNLEQALKQARVSFSSELMPMSRERYLFVSRRS